MIHPTAIIEPGAQIAESARIGAYAYIGPEVVIGPDSVIHHHATVEGNTTMGSTNEVFPYAFVGGRTQDKKWQGDSAPIVIGDRNIFREFCTVHPATFNTGETRIGSDNLFCSYSHVGHECRVGDHCVMSNNATLGGHCLVGDRVVIGGLTAVHQFCRVGSFAMVGGCGRVVQDILPYMMAEGQPVEHRTINKVGMQRGGFSDDDIQIARRAYKLIFRAGLNRSQALEKLKAGELGEHPIIASLVHLMETTERGIA